MLNEPTALGLPRNVGLWAMEYCINDTWHRLAVPDNTLAPLAKPPVFHYDEKVDAHNMLNKCFPNLPPEDKRVVRV